MCACARNVSRQYVASIKRFSITKRKKNRTEHKIGIEFNACAQFDTVHPVLLPSDAITTNC